MFGAGLFAGAVGYLFGSPLYQVKNRQQVCACGWQKFFAQVAARRNA
jgi:hypothetical protein